jgi:hypothetical protein
MFSHGGGGDGGADAVNLYNDGDHFGQLEHAGF